MTHEETFTLGELRTLHQDNFTGVARKLGWLIHCNWAGESIRVYLADTGKSEEDHRRLLEFLKEIDPKAFEEV